MQVLQNLTKLKGFYIKIAKDLIREERQLIEKWRKVADRKNEEEGNKTEPSYGMLGEALAVVLKKFIQDICNQGFVKEYSNHGAICKGQ